VIFTVWAPAAKSVELVTAERRVALQADSHGNWRADVDPAHVRDGYKYSIDGGKPLPDPRSRWQPEGVHGASYVLDAAELRESRSAAYRPLPLRDAVIYEIHIGTFTSPGTYAAAAERLPHLVELGITHVELMPLATFPGRRGWGYDGVDLYAPLPAYGTPRELARFVELCHAHGLAVLLDVVYNHLGPDGNYLGSYAPYFTDRVKTAWGEAINYDGAQSDEVRRFVIDNALMWLRDYGFDGLRLDAVHAIFSFEARHLLEELSEEVRRLGAEMDRSLLLIAESDLNDPRLVHPAARGGYGLSAHWVDDFHHALHRYFTGEDTGYYADFHGLADIAAALREGYVYQGQYSAHRQRRHGRPPRGVAPDQMVVCAQNHDQIGNRARGERLSMLLDVAQLKAIAALTLLSPFVPLLFQGEEWGASTPFLYFTDHEDPRLGRLVSEGRMREFAGFRWAGEVPDPQDPDTFERSKLDWSELERPPHAELLEWHRRLIALRRAKTGARRARPSIKFDARAEWLRFDHGGVLALFNFSDAAQRVPLPTGSWEFALSSEPDVAHPQTSPLFSHETRIFRREPLQMPRSESATIHAEAASKKARKVSEH
jgi:maltooligosyltrehalose trehalohydrolase